MDKLSRKSSPSIKFIASLVLVAFCFTSVSSSSLYAQSLSGSVHPHHGINEADPIAVVGSLKLPEELGIIQDQYVPRSDSIDKLVIYVQGAHTNYDAESNTKCIIDFFEKNYGLRLVLLEGGEGSFDNLFFKSFPDKQLKEKILNDYLLKGELSGGEAASILNERYETKYFGIETQSLYDANKAALLSALHHEKEIMSLLEKIKFQLDEESKSKLNNKSKTFLEQRAAFQNEEIDLIEYVKALTSLLPRDDLPDYPELSKILSVKTNEKYFKADDFNAAMTKTIQTFREKMLPRLSKEKHTEINQMIQMHQLGHLGQGMLLKRIEQLAQEMNFSFETPKALKATVKHAQTLSSIKGTDLFHQLEALENELRKTLPQSDEERSLVMNFYAVELLRNFARLEIAHRDWQEIKGRKPSQLMNSSALRPPRNDDQLLEHLDALFIYHYKFYELALKRDYSLFQNMVHRIKEEKVKLALVSTGGFHSEGMTQKLKAQKIPYVLIAPKISQMGERSVYVNVMEGKRSYMKDFSGNLWDALAKDYASKLAALLKVQDVTPRLKQWRDRIIQDSIAEGTVTRAKQYTKYVDALAQALKGHSPQIDMAQDQIREALQKELDSYFSSYFNQVEAVINDKLNIFSSGLKSIWKQGDITTKSISALLDEMAPKSHLAAELALVGGPGRRESARIVTDIDVLETSTPEIRAEMRNEVTKTKLSPMENLMVAISVMDVGAEIDGGKVVYKDSFRKLNELLPILADSGVAKIYLEGGLIGRNGPSEASKKIHQVPTDGTHFIRAGNATIKVTDYPTKRFTIDDLELKDNLGNPFSIYEMLDRNQLGLNPHLSRRDAHQDLKGFIEVAHDHGIKVVVDFIPWLSPDAINETNYKWTFYRELSEREDEAFRNQSEKEKQKWIEELLEQKNAGGQKINIGFFAVRLRENGTERVILVKHLLGMGGINVDQVILNPFHPEVQAYYSHSLQAMIDSGIDEVRIDLAHTYLKDHLVRYFYDLEADLDQFSNWYKNQNEPWETILSSAKNYARNRGTTVSFIMETYNERDQASLFELGADRVYFDKLFWTYLNIAKNGGSSRDLDGPFWQALFPEGRNRSQNLVYLTNLDQISLEAMGGSKEAASLFLIALSHLGVPIMVDWRDWLRHRGQLIPNVGGSNDSEHPHAHLFSSKQDLLTRQDFSKTKQATENSSWRRIINEFSSAVTTQKETFIKVLDNQNRDRFFSFAWKTEKDDWILIVLDMKSSGKEISIWVEDPREGKVQSRIENIKIRPEKAYQILTVNQSFTSSRPEMRAIITNKFPFNYFSQNFGKAIQYISDWRKQRRQRYYDQQLNLAEKDINSAYHPRNAKYLEGNQEMIDYAISILSWINDAHLTPAQKQKKELLMKRIADWQKLPRQPVSKEDLLRTRKQEQYHRRLIKILRTELYKLNSPNDTLIQIVFAGSFIFSLFAKKWVSLLVVTPLWFFYNVFIVYQNFKNLRQAKTELGPDLLEKRPWINQVQPKLTWMEMDSKGTTDFLTPPKGLILKDLIGHLTGILSIIRSTAEAEAEGWIGEAYAKSVIDIFLDNEILPSISNLVIFDENSEKISFDSDDRATRIPHEQVVRFINVVRDTIPGLSIEDASQDRAEIRSSFVEEGEEVDPVFRLPVSMDEIDVLELSTGVVESMVPQLPMVFSAMESKNVRVRAFGGVIRGLAFATQFKYALPISEVDLAVPLKHILTEEGFNDLMGAEKIYREEVVKRETKTGKRIDHLELHHTDEVSFSKILNETEWSVSKFWLEYDPVRKKFLLFGAGPWIEDLKGKKLSLWGQGFSDPERIPRMLNLALILFRFGFSIDEESLRAFEQEITKDIYEPGQRYHSVRLEAQHVIAQIREKMMSTEFSQAQEIKESSENETAQLLERIFAPPTELDRARLIQLHQELLETKKLFQDHHFIYEDEGEHFITYYHQGVDWIIKAPKQVGPIPSIYEDVNKGTQIGRGVFAPYFLIPSAKIKENNISVPEDRGDIDHSREWIVQQLVFSIEDHLLHIKSKWDEALNTGSQEKMEALEKDLRLILQEWLKLIYRGWAMGIILDDYTFANAGIASTGKILQLNAEFNESWMRFFKGATTIADLTNNINQNFLRELFGEEAAERLYGEGLVNENFDLLWPPKHNGEREAISVAHDQQGPFFQAGELAQIEAGFWRTVKESEQSAGPRPEARSEARSVNIEDLYRPAEVRYFKAIRELLFNQSQGSSVFVPASGSDITSILLSTNATKAVFVDLLPFGSNVTPILPEKRDEYFAMKKELTWNTGPILRDVAKNLRTFVVEELKGIGISNPTIEVDGEDPRIYHVRFRWAYPGEDPKNREFMFVGEKNIEQFSAHEIERLLARLAIKRFGGVVLKAGEYTMTSPLITGVKNRDVFITQLLPYLHPGSPIVTDVPLHISTLSRVVNVRLQELERQGVQFGYGPPHFTADIPEIRRGAFVYLTEAKEWEEKILKAIAQNDIREARHLYVEHRKKMSNQQLEKLRAAIYKAQAAISETVGWIENKKLLGSEIQIEAENRRQKALALDLAESDSQAWIIFADMMKLSLRDIFYGRKAADFFILNVIRITQKVILRYGGAAYRIGDRADEVAIVLPGKFTPEETESILQEVQTEIDNAFRTRFGFAQLNSALNETAVSQLSNQKEVITVQNLPDLRTSASGEVSVQETPSLLFEKLPNETTERRLQRILERSGLNELTAKLTEVQNPYLPAGATRLRVGAGTIEQRIKSSLNEADQYQGVAKERGLLFGIEKKMKLRRSVKETSLFGASMEQQLAQLAERLKKPEYRAYLRETEYSVFERRELIKILQDIRAEKSESLKVYVIRGPPDNFYFVVSHHGQWQIILVKQAIHAIDPKVGQAFNEILKRSRRSGEEEKFGFKVINDYFGHLAGNQLIKLDSLYLFKHFEDRYLKLDRLLSPEEILRALTDARTSINQMVNRHGFSVGFEATLINQQDVDQQVATPKILDLVDQLSAARRSPVVASNDNQYPGTKIKSYSENKNGLIWSNIEKEILLTRAYKRQRALGELLSAHESITVPVRSEVRSDLVNVLKEKGIHPEEFTTVVYPAAGNYDADLLAELKLNLFRNINEYHLNSLSYDPNLGGQGAGELVAKGLLNYLRTVNPQIKPEDITIKISHDNYLKAQFNFEARGRRIWIDKWPGYNGILREDPAFYASTLGRQIVRAGDLILVLPANKPIKDYPIGKEIASQITIPGYAKEDNWSVYQVTEDDFKNARSFRRSDERAEARAVSMPTGFFTDEELRRIEINGEILKRIYPLLTAEAKKILLYPTILLVFMGIKPGYVKGLEGPDLQKETPDHKILVQELKNLGVWDDLHLISETHTLYSPILFGLRAAQEETFLLETGLLKKGTTAEIILENISSAIQMKDWSRVQSEAQILYQQIYQDDSIMGDAFFGFLLGFPIANIRTVMNWRQNPSISIETWPTLYPDLTLIFNRDETDLENARRYLQRSILVLDYVYFDLLKGFAGFPEGLPPAPVFSRPELRNENEMVKQWIQNNEGETIVRSVDNEEFKFIYKTIVEEDSDLGEQHVLEVYHQDQKIGFFHFDIYEKEIDGKLVKIARIKIAFGFEILSGKGIWVHSKYRRRGLAASLLGLAIRIAKAKGAVMVQAEEVESPDLFEAAGFVPDSRSGDYELQLDQENLAIPSLEIKKPRAEMRRSGKINDHVFSSSGQLDKTKPASTKFRRVRSKETQPFFPPLANKVRKAPPKVISAKRKKVEDNLSLRYGSKHARAEVRNVVIQREMKIPYPKAGLRGLPDQDAEALFIDVDTNTTNGLSIIPWVERKAIPFTEEEKQIFQTDFGLTKDFDPSAHEIERVRHTFYNRSSGGISIWVAVKVKGREQEYYFKSEGTDTSAMQKLKAMQPSFSKMIDSAGSSLAISMGNMGDLPGNFVVFSRKNQGWEFFGANNEPWSEKEYRGLVELENGERSLGTIRLEDNPKTNEVQNVYFQPVGKTELVKLDLNSTRLILVAYTIGWERISSKKLLQQYYTKFSDLRHIFAFPFIEGKPLFYDQLLLGKAEEKIEAAFDDRALDFSVAQVSDHKALIDNLLTYGYRQKRRSEGVKKPGDYFILGDSIKLIFLPAVYPINGMAISKDGRHVAFINVKGFSGKRGAKYGTFYPWLRHRVKEAFGWNPAAFFIFDNGMDPQVVRDPQGINERLVFGGRDVLNAVMNVRGSATQVESVTIPVRSEMRSEDESVSHRLWNLEGVNKDQNFPIVVDEFDPKRVEISLLLNAAPNKRFRFDHQTKKLTWDDHEITFEEASKRVNLSWENLEAGFENASGQDQYTFSYHNLYWNDWFTAYDGRTRQLYHRKGEPFQERPYTMFVVWNDGHVSAEKLRFHSAEGVVHVFKEKDIQKKNNLSDRIKFAVFGQQIIRRGERVPLTLLASQFEDSFHLYRFPQFPSKLKGDSTAYGAYGEAIGVEETQSGPENPISPMDRTFMAKALTNDGYVEIKLQPYLEKGYGLDQIKKEALEGSHLSPFTYREVLLTKPENLRAGQYFIKNDTLHIRLHPALYPHNLVGITKDGKVISIVFTGDKTQGIGYSLSEIQDIVLKQFKNIEALFLLANSKDAFKRVNGQFVAPIGFKPYLEGTAAIEFRAPRQEKRQPIENALRILQTFLATREKFDVRTGMLSDEALIVAVKEALEEMDRTHQYPSKGFMVPVVISEEVLEAENFLRTISGTKEQRSEIRSGISEEQSKKLDEAIYGIIGERISPKQLQDLLNLETPDVRKVSKLVKQLKKGQAEAILKTIEQIKEIKESRWYLIYGPHSSNPNWQLVRRQLNRIFSSLGKNKKFIVLIERAPVLLDEEYHTQLAQDDYLTNPVLRRAAGDMETKINQYHKSATTAFRSKQINWMQIKKLTFQSLWPFVPAFGDYLEKKAAEGYDIQLEDEHLHADSILHYNRFIYFNLKAALFLNAGKFEEYLSAASKAVKALGLSHQLRDQKLFGMQIPEMIKRNPHRFLILTRGHQHLGSEQLMTSNAQGEIAKSMDFKEEDFTPFELVARAWAANKPFDAGNERKLLSKSALYFALEPLWPGDRIPTLEWNQQLMPIAGAVSSEQIEEFFSRFANTLPSNSEQKAMLTLEWLKGFNSVELNSALEKFEHFRRAEARNFNAVSKLFPEKKKVQLTQQLLNELNVAIGIASEKVNAEPSFAEAAQYLSAFRTRVRREQIDFLETEINSAALGLLSEFDKIGFFENEYIRQTVSTKKTKFLRKFFNAARAEIRAKVEINPFDLRAPKQRSEIRSPVQKLRSQIPYWIQNLPNLPDDALQYLSISVLNSESNRIPPGMTAQLIEFDLKDQYQQLKGKYYMPGNLLAIWTPSGQIRLALETSDMNDGIFYVELSASDPLYQYFYKQLKTRYEEIRQAPAKPVSDFLNIPWINDLHERNDVENLFKDDFVLNHLLNHPASPKEYLNLEGVFRFYASPVIELKDGQAGSQMAESGLASFELAVLLRDFKRSHADGQVLAHEMGHLLLDGRYGVHHPIYEEIKKYVFQESLETYVAVRTLYSELFRKIDQEVPVADRIYSLQQHLIAHEFILRALETFYAQGDSVSVLGLEKEYQKRLNRKDIELLIRVGLLPPIDLPQGDVNEAYYQKLRNQYGEIAFPNRRKGRAEMRFSTAYAQSLIRAEMRLAPIEPSTFPSLNRLNSRAEMRVEPEQPPSEIWRLGQRKSWVTSTGLAVVGFEKLSDDQFQAQFGNGTATIQIRRGRQSLIEKLDVQGPWQSIRRQHQGSVEQMTIEVDANDSIVNKNFLERNNVSAFGRVQTLETTPTELRIVHYFDGRGLFRTTIHSSGKIDHENVFNEAVSQALPLLKAARQRYSEDFINVILERGVTSVLYRGMVVLRIFERERDRIWPQASQAVVYKGRMEGNTFRFFDSAGDLVIVDRLGRIRASEFPEVTQKVYQSPVASGKTIGAVSQVFQRLLRERKRIDSDQTVKAIQEWAGAIAHENQDVNAEQTWAISLGILRSIKTPAFENEEERMKYEETTYKNAIELLKLPGVFLNIHLLGLWGRYLAFYLDALKDKSYRRSFAFLDQEALLFFAEAINPKLRDIFRLAIEEGFIWPTPWARLSIIQKTLFLLSGIVFSPASLGVTLWRWIKRFFVFRFSKIQFTDEYPAGGDIGAAINEFLIPAGAVLLWQPRRLPHHYNPIFYQIRNLKDLYLIRKSGNVGWAIIGRTELEYARKGSAGFHARGLDTLVVDSQMAMHKAANVLTGLKPELFPATPPEIVEQTKRWLQTVYSTFQNERTTPRLSPEATKNLDQFIFELYQKAYEPFLTVANPQNAVNQAAELQMGHIFHHELFHLISTWFDLESFYGKANKELIGRLFELTASQKMSMSHQVFKTSVYDILADLILEATSSEPTGPSIDYENIGHLTRQILDKLIPGFSFVTEGVQEIEHFAERLTPQFRAELLEQLTPEVIKDRAMDLMKEKINLDHFNKIGTLGITFPLVSLRESLEGEASYAQNPNLPASFRAEVRTQDQISAHLSSAAQSKLRAEMRSLEFDEVTRELRERFEKENFSPEVALYPASGDDIGGIELLIKLFPTLKHVILVDPIYRGKRYADRDDLLSRLHDWGSRLKPIHEIPFEIKELEEGKPFRFDVVVENENRKVELVLIPNFYDEYTSEIIKERADISLIRSPGYGWETNLSASETFWFNIVRDTKDGGFLIGHYAQEPFGIAPDRLEAFYPLKEKLYAYRVRPNARAEVRREMQTVPREVVPPSVAIMAREFIGGLPTEKEVERLAKAYAPKSDREKNEMLQKLRREVFDQLKQIQDEARQEVSDQILNELLDKKRPVTAQEVEKIVRETIPSSLRGALRVTKQSQIGIASALLGMPPRNDDQELILFQEIARLVNQYQENINPSIVQDGDELTVASVVDATNRLNEFLKPNLDRLAYILSEIFSPDAVRRAADLVSLESSTVFVFQFSSPTAAAKAGSVLKRTKTSGFEIFPYGNRLFIFNSQLPILVLDLKAQGDVLITTQKVVKSEQFILFADHFGDLQESPISEQDYHRLIIASALLSPQPGQTYRFTSREELLSLTSAFVHVLANRVHELELQARAA